MDIENKIVQTKVEDLKVGDIILDGIASRVDAVLPDERHDEVYVGVTDGNGYSGSLRLRMGTTLTHFPEWTDEDWTYYRSI